MSPARRRPSTLSGARSNGAGERGPNVGRITQEAVMDPNWNALEDVAEQFEHARDAAEAGAAAYLELESENDQLRAQNYLLIHMLARAIAGWPPPTGGNGVNL